MSKIKCSYTTCIHSEEGYCKKEEITLKDFYDTDIFKDKKLPDGTLAQDYISNYIGSFSGLLCDSYKMDWRKVSPRLYKTNGKPFEYCPVCASKLVNNVCILCNWDENLKDYK